MQSSAQRLRLDVVDEQPLAVELDHRQPLAVAGLELGIAVDQDLLELESELVAKVCELPACPIAERAAFGVIEGDEAYG
ncbi:MAG: hypothetical protein WBB74_01790 [Gaiellaceae bacterium]